MRLEHDKCILKSNIYYLAVNSYMLCAFNYYSELTFSVKSLLALTIFIFMPYFLQNQKLKIIREPIKHAVFKQGYLCFAQHRINVESINRVVLSKTPQFVTFVFPYNYGNEGKLIEFNFPIGDYELFKSYLSGHIPSITFID
ncbi:hypothetical protein HG263_08265 [Pseudoalteromonas sp. JBTF-M23]|uniref:Uncharacterized protein n=1 Tax=Pseudoalteromonas caenipelagi TaxID=2726988 RepID=A0A849VF29_9GAMM|nr:hypothetical protein [Pseudoalteromonas caenipelagi]NOU50534.1 hypothetical protein [Pseudoalteromonas caenipelagi]